MNILNMKNKQQQLNGIQNKKKGNDIYNYKIVLSPIYMVLISK